METRVTPVRRVRFLTWDEVARHAPAVLLRARGVALSTEEIAARIISDREFPADDASLKDSICRQVGKVLQRLAACGQVEKRGHGREARWALAPGD